MLRDLNIYEHLQGSNFVQSIKLQSLFPVILKFWKRFWKRKPLHSLSRHKHLSCKWSITLKQSGKCCACGLKVLKNSQYRYSKVPIWMCSR